MENDTRSSRKNKDDETKSSKGMHSSGKGSTTPGDSSGLRRSARETPSKKKMIPCPSSARKSERLEKQTPTTLPVKRKSERIEKQRTPTPLRRPLRGKKQQTLSSSEIKKSDKSPGSSNVTRKKEKMEKSARQLTVGTGEFSKSKKQDTKYAQVEKKRMDARTFWQLFIRRKKRDDATDPGEQLRQQDKLRQGHSTADGGGGSIQAEDGGHEWGRTEKELREEYRACERSMEGCESNVRIVEKNTLEYQSEDEVSCSRQKESCEFNDEDGLHVSRTGDNSLPSTHAAIEKETIDFAEALVVGCSAAENLQTKVLLDSISKERSLDGIDLVGGGNKKPLKRKRNAEDMDFDASAIAASKHNCTSTAELSQRAFERDLFSERCVTCSKKQRLDIHLPILELCCSCDKRLDQEIRDISTPKGRRKVEVTVTTAHAENYNTNLQLMEPPVDIQTNVDENSCVVCKLGGKLLCCDGKGCKRSYHVSCLNPPLEDFPPGAWHCLFCVKKKIESGVQSVSGGIESIWDAREVKVSDFDGPQKQKQYFVKYKGLAHIHNCWIPESQLLLEAPLLVAKFNINNQVANWKIEWTMPHRFLKKRLVVFPIQCDEHHISHAGKIGDSHCEWLVKWRGLDYEHATWELANASIFNSPAAEILVKEYENRREKAKRASIFSNVDKIPQTKKGPLTKLVKLPVQGSSGINNNHLISVNKLREHWHKGWNAVVFDDLERIMKVISFILSLQSDSCRPFLVVSASSALSMWEAEFLRLAPCIDVVVYSGNKEIRRRIRRLELYEEGHIMFQVLLSPPEAIVEDLKLFKCLGWEAIILDDCQHSRISTHFERIKMLATGFRLLYVSGQFKDTASEYLNMLSLLENGGDTSTRAGNNDNISTLKDMLLRHIAYECKLDSSRFAEYWVRVRISDVQLEQYCATLLSNSTSLRSCTKNDLMGALREILTSVRKCCDHPYLVDSNLKTLMSKDLPAVEYLDVGIKASGKLQVLDKMLLEIKNRGLKVLILFQAIGGYGRDSTGSYLDDFLCQRFGPDSYEHVDGGGLVPSKKQAALNRFNNESGKFVFLLENRACLPSIKLSSVDCIIIFDSDWNPVNDLRALQRITIDSKSEQIKLFRLYSSYTVEEKVLILAKQDATLDSSLHNLNCSSSHKLLMWGAFYLFKKCDEFHDRTSNTSFSRANISSEQSLLNDVIQEFTIILSQDGENEDAICSSTILKVHQNGGAYGGNDLLLGELEVQSMEEELPHVFWTKILEGRQPRWKYFSGSTQRNRKRVQYNDNLSENPKVESKEIVKKCKKVINNSIGVPSTKPGLDEGKVVIRDKKGHERYSKQLYFLVTIFFSIEKGFVWLQSVHIIFPAFWKLPFFSAGTPANYASQTLLKSAACANDSRHANHISTSPLCSNGISPEPEARLGESEEIRKRRDTRKNLHLLLKPEIFKLCQILEFKEDVKGMVGRLLEYIMDNHHVDTESATILQAFQLSLCWIAASLMKRNIDRKDSLAVAKQHLKFGCKEEEVDCIYLMLLKKFNSNESHKIAGSPLNPVLTNEDGMEDPEHARFSQLRVLSQKVKLEVDDTPLRQECSSKHVFPMGLASEIRMTKKKLKAIKRIEKKSRKRMSSLLQKHDDEEHELKRIYEEEKVQLENEYQVELAVVRSIHGQHPSRIDKLKILEETYEKKLKEHSLQMDIRLQYLKERLMAAKDEEKGRKARLLEEVNSWPQVDSLGKVPLNKSAQGGEHVHASDEVTDDGPENVASVFSHLSEERRIDGDVPRMQGGGVGLFGISEAVSNGIPEIVSSETISNEASRSSRTVALKMPNKKIDETDTLSSERVTDTRPDQQNISGKLKDGPECPGYLNPLSEPQTHNRNMLLEEGEIPPDVPEIAPDEVVEGCQSNRWHDGQFLVNPTTLQPIPAEGLNEALQRRDEFSQLATKGMRDDDAPANEKHISSQEVEVRQLHSIDAVPSDNHEAPVVVHVVHSNQEAPVVVSALQPAHEAPLIEPAVLLQPSSCTDSPPATQNSNTQVEIPPSHHPTPSVSSNQEVPVVETIVQLQLSPSQPGNQPDVPFFQNQPNPPTDCASTPGQSTNAAQIIEPLVQLQLSPSIGFPSSHNQPDLPSTSGMEYLRSSEDVYAQNAQTTTAVVDNLVGHLNQILIRPATNVSRDSPIDTVGGIPLSRTRTMPVISDFCNHSIQTASTASVMASWMPQHTYIDPLQNESERIRREMEETIKIHEEMKLRVKSDYEKEIEEVISQIRRKYETILQDIEAQFLLKKQELDATYKKVYMSKILAEAFRSKCMDLRASGKQGLTQQLVQLPLQQTMLRAPIVAGPSTAALPAHSTQGTAPPRPSIVAVPSSVGPLASIPQTIAPLVQVVHHPASLFSSAPTRPLHISTITLPAGNVLVGTAIRAPAPHLQPFRPSITLYPNSLLSLPRRSPNQQAPSNPLDSASQLSARSFPPPPAYGPPNRTSWLERV